MVLCQPTFPINTPSETAQSAQASPLNLKVVIWQAWAALEFAQKALRLYVDIDVHKRKQLESSFPYI